MSFRFEIGAEFPSVLLTEGRAALEGKGGRGWILRDTLGETVVEGDVLYRKNDSKWWRADADEAATMPGAGLALEAGDADDIIDILLAGIMTKTGWTYTSGQLLYVHTTPGPPTSTRPAGGGDQVQVIALALTATTIMFNLGYDIVEVA